MKPFPANQQLGLASPLQYAAIQSGKNQKPLHEGDGAGCKATSRSPEGRGEKFFLDILFYRMSEIAAQLFFLEK
jgi:hypothetical protein